MAEIGGRVLVTWAVDGSGVFLRREATLLALLDTVAMVRFDAGTVPETLAAKAVEGIVRVDPRDLTEVGTYAPLASFNWLD